uniref:Uncharacterized protein n=1 Tax=Ciona intestinalis TaxID=7719 RepID=H2XM59_CIOIN
KVVFCDFRHIYKHIHFFYFFYEKATPHQVTCTYSQNLQFKSKRNLPAILVSRYCFVNYNFEQFLKVKETPAYLN